MGFNLRADHAAGISRGRPTDLLERGQSTGPGPGFLAFFATGLLSPCAARCAIVYFGDAFIIQLNVNKMV